MSRQPCPSVLPPTRRHSSDDQIIWCRARREQSDTGLGSASRTSKKLVFRRVLDDRTHPSVALDRRVSMRTPIVVSVRSTVSGGEVASIVIRGIYLSPPAASLTTKSSIQARVAAAQPGDAPAEAVLWHLCVLFPVTGCSADAQRSSFGGPTMHLVRTACAPSSAQRSLLLAASPCLSGISQQSVWYAADVQVCGHRGSYSQRTTGFS
jgi:hypothetical protein